MRTHNQIMHGKKDWRGSKVHRNTETWTELMVSQWNSSGISSQDSPHCSCVNKVQEFHEQNGRPNTIPRTDYLHVYVQDIIWGSEDNERECIANATLVTLFAKRFPAGRWSFFGPGSEKMWYSTYIDRPQKEWDRVAELMMIKFRETGTPSFPSHESIVPRNAEKQRWWEITYTLLCRWRYD